MRFPAIVPIDRETGIGYENSSFFFLKPTSPQPRRKESWTTCTGQIMSTLLWSWGVGLHGNFELLRTVTDINRRARDTEKSWFNYSSINLPSSPLRQKKITILSNIRWRNINILVGHVQYINILTRLKGFQDKIANSQETSPLNIEVCPKNFGAPC